MIPSKRLKNLCLTGLKNNAIPQFNIKITEILEKLSNTTVPCSSVYLLIFPVVANWLDLADLLCTLFKIFPLCIPMLNFARQLSLVENHLKIECFVHRIAWRIMHKYVKHFIVNISNINSIYCACRLLQIIQESPTLLYGSPNLPDKTNKST